MEARHCSSSEKKAAKENPPFAFAFLPLKNSDGTVLQDGQHVIPTYKYVKNEDDPAYYLKTADDGVKLQSRKENIILSVQLCSTQVTQNVSLLNLLMYVISVVSMI